MRGRGSVPSDKYDRGIHLTAGLIPFYRSIVGSTWADMYKSVSVVKGSKFITVPKTAKTDRGICIEPGLNMYVQLGIGAYIRKRLSFIGLDISHQDRNQELARRAYKCNFATIDLSAASDSISRVLVERALPPDWVSLLSSCRSYNTVINGVAKPLEKFSSMGNGFTFELETLLFYALCKVIIPSHFHSDISVYGDDIIVPQEYANDLIEALEFLGFRVNQQKSFLAGNFFESCGTDWFKGVNVRPFYLKGSKYPLPYSVQIANKLRLYAAMRGGDVCQSRFRPLWLKLFRLSPKLWRMCPVPPILGDQGIITSKDESRNWCKPDNEIEGMMVSIVPMKARYKTKQSVGTLLYCLARIGAPLPKKTNGKEPVRGFLGLARPKRTLVSKWPSSLTWG